MSPHLLHGVVALIALNAQTIPDGDAVDIRQSTVTTLGHCHIGGGAISSDRAELDVWDDRSQIETTQVVRKGQLLDVCGALHRVVALIELPSNGLPGGDPSTAYITARAVKTPKRRAGAVVLTIDGEVAHFGPRRAILNQLALVSGARGIQARFTVDVDGIETLVSGGAGDVVAIGAARHRILAVTPPSEARGIPSWVEIELRPRSAVPGATAPPGTSAITRSARTASCRPSTSQYWARTTVPAFPPRRV